MLLIYLFASFTEAREFLVGSKTNAWKIPSSEAESLNKWAEASRFQIGDSLGIFSHFLHLGSCSFASWICIIIRVVFFAYFLICSLELWSEQGLCASSEWKGLRELQYFESYSCIQGGKHQGEAW